jgi:cation:H+ antiporter
MIGANRLLIGLAWPLVVLLGWLRTRRRVVPLPCANSPEVAFLGAATLYSFVIVLKERIGLFDAAVLIGLFAAYLWRVSRVPEEEGEELVGPAAAIARLPHRRQHLVIAGLVVFAAAVILAAAEPFAESLVAIGREWEIDEFLLIQWLAPLASEAPMVVVAVLDCLRARPTTGLAALASDKINQWTLLVGMLPVVYSVAAGRSDALPLDARQREEFFLTAAQSAFAVALLLRLGLGPVGAFALFVLFAGQLSISFALRADDARSVRVLTGVAWVYLALAALTLVWQGRRAWDVARVGLFDRRPPDSPGDRATVPPAAPVASGGSS